MRQIGQLTDPAQARTFGDFLLGKGIRNDMERETDGSYSIWIRDEDQLAPARTWLEKFLQNPAAADFQSATAAAERARSADAKDQEAYRQRVKTRKSLFTKMGGYGVGLLTYALIFLCLVVAVYSKLGKNDDFNRALFISDPDVPHATLLPEVFSGQVWRLFTPIFLHFGPVHLIFNLMWLYQLGCMIEARRGTGVLAALVAVIALGSNLAQIYFGEHPNFGGMSGVVYGLAGYVWIFGRYYPASGVGLDSQNITILLVWMVICYTGQLGPVANYAHTGGLLVGVVWGRLSAYFASNRPE